jgi:tetratricopeptide (TPR) repeat protein
MKIFCVFFVAVLTLALAATSLEAKPRKSKKPDETADAAPGEQAAGGGGNAASHEGIEAAKAGDWNKAIESFKRAGLEDANNRYNLAIAYRQRGLAEIKQQNWDAAINDFGEALKLKEDDATAHRFRAFAYMSKQDWNNALEDYTTVLKEKKNDVEALERRAFVEMQLKQYDKALADYSDAIKQQPKNVDALLGRSYIYEVTKKIEPGLSDVEAVLKIQPTNGEASNRRKRLLAEKTKDQPAPIATPTLIGTPIPRQPAPPPKAKSSASPATSASPH